MTRKEVVKACEDLLEELISRYSHASSSRFNDKMPEVEERGEARVDSHHLIFTGLESELLHRCHLNGIYDFILLVADKSGDPDWWNVCDYVNILFSFIVFTRLGATDAEVVHLIFNTDFSTYNKEEDQGDSSHHQLSDRSVEHSLHSHLTTTNSRQSDISGEKRDGKESNNSKKLLHAVQVLLYAQQSVVGGCSFPGQLLRTLLGCKTVRLMVQGWCLRKALMVSTSLSQGSDPSRDCSWGDPSEGGASPPGPSRDGISFISRLRSGLVSSDFLLCAESWKTLRAVFLPGISPSTRAPVGVSIDTSDTGVPTQDVALSMSSVGLPGGFAQQRCFSVELLQYSFPNLGSLLCSAMRCRSYLARQEALRFVEDVILDPKYTTVRGLYLSSAELLSAVLSTANEKSMLSSELIFTIIKAFAQRLSVSDEVCELLVRSRSEILRFAYQYCNFMTCSGSNEAHCQRIFASIEELRTCLEPFSFTG
ncbi:unnamed protein product [Phytomonas sp. EM1]|nr:unnamed protein product [Phytomonas sp. EM1]|eukprot:CCW61695.1 unnamed protein product [Phytomonas sp. isolate EM1]